MPHKILFAVLSFPIFFSFMNLSSFALQSGVVLDPGGILDGTESVIGPAIEGPEPNFTLTALCVGGQKAWYPPILVLDLRNQTGGDSAGQPILIKIKNTLPLSQGFEILANSPFGGPTSMNVKLVVNSGETKFISIATSSLTFVTNGNGFSFRSHMDNHMQGGELLLLR